MANLKIRPVGKSITISFIFYLLIWGNIFSQNEHFNVRIVNPDTKSPIKNNQLNYAWELTYGADDSLWIIENKSYLVSKKIRTSEEKHNYSILAVKEDFQQIFQTGRKEV